MNVTQLLSAYRDRNCSAVYAKRLADNDNSKNQVYLGSDFQTLNIFPNLDIAPASTGSYEKPIFKAKLNFKWIDQDGAVWDAPAAQIIFYPQYPEVRFSGFLKGCKNAPSELMTVREAGRWLVFGIKNDGEVLGFVIGPKHGIALELEQEFTDEALFYDLTARLKDGRTSDTKSTLLKKLKGICAKEWMNSKRLLADGTLGPCNAPNCGGYTLEAELGITPNGFSEPDYLGWEIKQYSVSDLERVDVGRITLMTPEPTGGYYVERGVVDFLRKYGYPDRAVKDRLNFSSPHYMNKPNNKTNLRLLVDGYDEKSAKITNAYGGIVVMDSDEQVVARWDFNGLMKHWNRKHALAAYIPSRMRNDPVLQYQYGHLVRLGIGTDFLRFIKAFAAGHVYYDPGIKVTDLHGSPVTKRRNQFRILTRNVPALYKTVETVDLFQCD
jgi:hypothetical protein